MNKVNITDKDIANDLFPFSLTRSAADIRVGILTLREKWKAYLDTEVAIGDEGIPASTIPGTDKIIKYPWDIFLLNDYSIREDYKAITAGKISAPVPSSVHTIHPQNIFIEEGAKLSHCVINAETGPVYIGKNAEVMEGALIRGPFALCEGAVVKMGSRIYGATTVGPYSSVGGEIKNSVIFGYSNKAHDGYLGDSVIGEWCNLGAGTSNSNVKNNAGDIKIWHQATNSFISTGMMKCGLLMGDYSRAAINTSFNTGTIAGVAANIFGEGLAPKFIPSFSWGCSGERYKFSSALEHIGNWKKLKGQEITEQEKTILKLIFEQK